jgi:hypothetical protein
MMQFSRGALSPMPNDRTEPGAETKPASRALVPLTVRVERRARRRWYRWAPDPIFVTHLIAQAEQVPQARRIRRASAADAQAAYRPHQAPALNVGSRTRQVV